MMSIGNATLRERTKFTIKTALLVILLISVTGTSMAAEHVGDPNSVYRILLEEEVNVARAILKKDTKALEQSADRLGFLVDTAQDRVDSGGKASACEFAAQSL
jgi:hypothetical protein